MNDTMIEEILRKAPRPKMPAGLTERLKANIALPQPELGGTRRGDWRPFLKRWTPALSFGAFLLGCLIAIAVQSNVLSELRRENETLRVTTQNLEQLRQENARYQQLSAEAQQLEQLRKDNAELQRLRAETAQLREQLQELAHLRAENQRLLAQRQAAQAAAAAQLGEEDPIGMAKEKAKRVQCVSHMKQIVLAARIWSNKQPDRGLKEAVPVDFLTMQNELNSPKILTCPGETNRPVSRAWSEFSGSSYVILSPGVDESRPEIVYLHCPLHNNVGLVDGSVSQLGPKFTIVQNEEGNWIVKRQP
jgi:hypothetical protein